MPKKIVHWSYISNLNAATEGHEAIYHFTTDSNPDWGYWIGVNKAGGGTVGKKYTGEHWIISVYDGETEQLIKADVIYVGQAADHYKAASEFLDFVEEE